jgi:hypothetical protein
MNTFRLDLKLFLRPRTEATTITFVGSRPNSFEASFPSGPHSSREPSDNITLKFHLDSDLLALPHLRSQRLLFTRLE